MKAGVTISDVADRASVSVATVSRAMNGHASLRGSTRQKVVLAAQELGYRTGFGSKSCFSHRVMNLGLLFSEDMLRIGDFLYKTEISSELLRIAARERITLIPESMQVDETNRVVTPKIISEGRLNGLFILGYVNESQLRQVANWGIPTCLFQRYASSDGIVGVGLDYEAGSREVVQYLAATGHDRIGFIYGATDYPSNIGKKKGFLDATKEFHLDGDVNLIYQVHDEEQDFKGGYRAACHFWAMDNPPSAIFCVTDWLAIGVQKALSDNGVNVPKDVSVVGFDDSFLSRQCLPALTSVGVDFSDFAQTAMDLLIKKIQGRHINSYAVNSRPYLVPRESCDKGPRARESVVSTGF